MENTVYIALSQQTILRQQLNVIANNLANMNTVAYKNESMVFQRYLQPVGGGQPLSFAEAAGMIRDMKEGPLEKTGNPLDIAMDGPGFLTVQAPSGNEYTRNGHLHLNDKGELVTSDGFAVLGAGGKPITINPSQGKPTIGSDGTISNGSGVVGKIGVVKFKNPQTLQEIEGGYFTANGQTPTAAAKTQIVQGMVEQSNVNPVQEITRMLSLLRNYQSSQNVLTSDNQRKMAAIQDLAKVA